MDMELKDRIKKARKDAGYKSRDTLADFLGTTRDTIAAYEQGRVVPNDVFLQLMATKLNISYDWLKFGKGEMISDTVITSAFLSNLPADDKEIIEIYLSLDEKSRQVLKDFAVKVAKTQQPTAKEQTPSAPVAELKRYALTEEEWLSILRKREAKDGHSEAAS